MPELRLHGSLDEIPASAWDGLPGDDHPFLRHAFLSGLESTGCLRTGWGWSPCHVSLWQAGELRAAMPAYLKGNSHGEFVFDHAWAAAYQRHGLDYYPKLLVGVPYTPVTGPRLLAGSGSDRAALIAALTELPGRLGVSSIHANFLHGDEDAQFPPDWLARHDVQYHWRNDSGWRDFDDFLAALSHKKRKNIRQERARVMQAGIDFRLVHGDEASEADLAAMHAFYLDTFAGKGNSPALTLDFFRHLARTMPRSLLLVLAERDGETLAGALFLRSAATLYGRYWGGRADIPGLHFETCYYQGIAYCLRHGLTRFEPGAQGEHKVARGFLPVLTRSRHFIAHPAFAEALNDWCRQERRATADYLAAVLRHSPFRDEPADPRPAA